MFSILNNKLNIFLNIKSNSICNVFKSYGFNHSILALAVYIFFIQSYEYKTLKTSLKQGIIGFIPVVLWSLFALYYYGSVFANSVIAKTNLGLPRVQLQIQGFSYLYIIFYMTQLLLSLFIVHLFMLSFLKIK